MTSLPATTNGMKQTKNNQDGSSHNASWNCGVEGRTDDAAINQLRMRQLKKFLGLPSYRKGHRCSSLAMSLAGPRGGKQYCQHSEISWLNWHIKERATL